MSETEVHRGKLTPVVLNGITDEERAEDACRRLLGVAELPSYYEDWVECLEEVGSHRLITIGDVTYSVDNTELDSFGFELANRNPDGTIDYFISFYNGGAWWGEIVEAAVENIDGEG